MPQPFEGPDELFVLIIDETYGESDDETYEIESERYRRELEREFGREFREANIGPGADLPAFLTVLTTTQVPLWAVLLATFFAGRSIKENLNAWSEMAKALKRFFGRPVMLGRQGAAVIALEAIMDEMDGLPKAVRLLGYTVDHLGDPAPLIERSPIDTIADVPDTLVLGMALHVFEIEADGVRFRASVDGKNVSIVRLDDEQR